MWVIVVFVDEVIAAVPISWIINSNGNKYCVWPLQDERQKRSKSEIPPSLLTDDWELHECVILLDGGDSLFYCILSASDVSIEQSKYFVAVKRDML